MAEPKAPPGAIVWTDLTVADAPGVRDFYQAVVGWRPEPVPMGGYDDYSMLRPGADDPVAGVCHARGVNARLPPRWIVYVAVDNLDRALAEALRRGGKVLDGPRAMGELRFAAIEDPAGAAIGLIGP